MSTPSSNTKSPSRQPTSPINNSNDAGGSSELPVVRTVSELTVTLTKLAAEYDDDIQRKLAEDTILEFGKTLVADKNTEQLKALIVAVRPHLPTLGSAKSSKVVRQLVDYTLSIDDDPQMKVDLCKDCIAWATDQKRVYLAQSLSARYIKLLNDVGKHTEAAVMIQKLSYELRKLDDKELLMEVQLEESKAMFALQNLGKARTAIASARSTANAIYLSPKIQAALDMQSGILHASEDKDFKTAFSYFYEAFENHDSADDRVGASKALKYMCLTKVLLGEADQVKGILASKLGQKYDNSELRAMKDIATAFQTRTLRTFLEAFEKYKKELHEDPLIKVQFNALSEKMLEQEITRVIEPYKVVEIDHVARRIQLPKQRVEKKLAQMLLDKNILGCIDQSVGVLCVYGNQEKSPVCELVVKNVKALHDAVDVSQERAMKLRVGYVNPMVQKVIAKTG